MAVPLLPDDLWLVLEPLLPPHRPQPRGGRPPVPHRRVLTGILFVLRTGLPWDYRPTACGLGSPATLGRRLRDWQAQGLWQELWLALLQHLAQRGAIDWDHALIDSSVVRAVGTPASAAAQAGLNPVDRPQTGSKRHLITEGQGVPLTLVLTGAQRNDAPPAMPLLDSLPALVGPRGGRPKRKPAALVGDAAYGRKNIMAQVRQRRIKPLLAPPRREHGSGLGRLRCKVEDTFKRLHAFRRWRTPYERRADIHLAFLLLGCALITWQHLRPTL